MRNKFFFFSLGTDPANLNPDPQLYPAHHVAISTPGPLLLILQRLRIWLYPGIFYPYAVKKARIRAQNLHIVISRSSSMSLFSFFRSLRSVTVVTGFLPMTQ